MDIGPSEKLSEVISYALGAWIAPWAMKRVAKAEAEAERIKTIPYLSPSRVNLVIVSSNDS